LTITIYLQFLLRNEDTVTMIEELKYHRISTSNRIFKKISKCTFGDITNVYKSVSSIEAQKLQLN